MLFVVIIKIVLRRKQAKARKECTSIAEKTTRILQVSFDGGEENKKKYPIRLICEYRNQIQILLISEKRSKLSKHKQKKTHLLFFCLCKKAIKIAKADTRKPVEI